ncbi:cell division protein FtsZ [Neptunomonas sp.]|uniref:cell division protein FtsZ n=1 Tax=Neptunomonas sp. TaxID=1971898 RepID=UPI0025E02C92|nr:cell division protein FtsZ [Neptunomonas sp.]
MFELLDSVPQNAVIKVIGVGGGGGNAVEHMVQTELEGVEFMCVNTDAQALAKMSAKELLQLGSTTTKGLGAGADPEIGRLAAVEDREHVAELLDGADMVFITAGMGGGTGTGAAPIVAEVARELGILTVAVVTKPFPFEGRKRMKLADEGITELRENVDSLIIIPNEKLMKVLGRNCSLINAFNTANDVLRGAVQGIADLITRPGMINVDFADVRTVMSEMGMAMMGTGSAKGEDRATVAAEAAINSPLLEDVDLKGASGILVNITAGLDLSLGEFTEVGNIVEEYASDDATIVVGTVIDPEMKDDIKVTVVATGFDKRVEEPVKVVASTNRSSNSSVSTTQIELPTVLRRQKQEALLEPATKQALSSDKQKDVDMLDIPTYIRRQAD